ncbi:MAG TPA: cytochrome d ubiquinol oxidase subunit II [Myxococcales bacterium]|nr:cytochrome d ubiquinol oxidase subunit II [Myxococcales bacterium]
MQTVWYVLVAFMLTAYVVLDGFDLGAGAVHLFIARKDEERRAVLRSIGPVWDGNEVWLIAAGGTLFFAFPALYASSFSGFYLPLNMVLWLLMLRAVGIEFRAHIDSPVWRGFFDGAFSLSSALLALFFGAALGNVVRGVPLRPDGTFFEPLWTDFRVGKDNGILDWFTVLCGVLALAALMVHGSAWVAYKTEGAVQLRARRVASAMLGPLLLLAAAALFAALSLSPHLLDNYRRHWLAGALIPAAAAASFAALWFFSRRRKDRSAFLASCALLASLLAGVAFALHPRVLPASTSDAYSLTIYNAASGDYSLRYGVYWWSAGMLIAIGYFVLVYRMFRGKVRLDSDGHGY